MYTLKRDLIGVLHPLLMALSEEFGVPKPNYCVFQVSALKKLDHLFSDSKYGITITRSGGGWKTLPWGPLSTNMTNLASSPSWFVGKFRYEEERITKRETRKWLREHPLPHKNTRGGGLLPPDSPGEDEFSGPCSL
jgi:hypothetical protein